MHDMTVLDRVLIWNRVLKGISYHFQIPIFGTRPYWVSENHHRAADILLALSFMKAIDNVWNKLFPRKFLYSGGKALHEWAKIILRRPMYRVYSTPRSLIPKRRPRCTANYFTSRYRREVLRFHPLHKSSCEKGKLHCDYHTTAKTNLRPRKAKIHSTPFLFVSFLAYACVFHLSRTPTIIEENTVSFENGIHRVIPG